MNYIRWFQDISITDIPVVGGKNASLGQMLSHLASEGITVPNGFAVTADAYWHYLEHNKLRNAINAQLATINVDDARSLRDGAVKIRQMIEAGTIPVDLKNELLGAYTILSTQYQSTECDVAVRSSATAEDLPNASFAGQQETYLNVRGADAVCRAYKKSLSSLFTDRAIAYRARQGFDHFEVSLSVGVQKMIRSDKASSGVAFSLDPETGFADVVVINGSYGLGELIVKGVVTPDEFVVHKPTLRAGYASIIKKRLGDKKTALVYGDSPDAQTVTVSVPESQYFNWCLSDAEILELARMVCTIEAHYSSLTDHTVAMDVEWAKDGIDGKLYIIQARPETVHGAADERMTLSQYRLTSSDELNVVLTGQSIGQRIVSGTVRIVRSVSDIDRIQSGDILVTEMTDPDWVPAMKRAVGIVTELGGRTCHAAIVSRELHVPAIVGAVGATHLLHDGQQITIDCSQGLTGHVYEGTHTFEVTTQALSEVPHIETQVMVNIADPDSAFQLSKLPVAGVGLARIEFIISGQIRVHPCALLYPEKLDQKTTQKVATLTAGYASSSADYFIDLLAQGIGMIAAAFYPRPVIVRLSDFKTNEYRNLIGGTFFEPQEENPMIGLRGASRYYHPDYQAAFALECKALMKVRTTMGLDNVRVMVPFVRTVAQAQKVIDCMAHQGLVRGQNGLQIYMMCELPSNVICIDQFSTYFDGFSIGSNDLTQMTLGVDRDSALLASMFDERDEAVKWMMAHAIAGAQTAKKPIGICGQAPSDYPEIAEFLIAAGITSLSLNPDFVLPFLMRYKK